MSVTHMPPQHARPAVQLPALHWLSMHIATPTTTLHTCPPGHESLSHGLVEHLPSWQTWLSSQSRQATTHWPLALQYWSDGQVTPAHGLSRQVGGLPAHTCMGGQPLLRQVSSMHAPPLQMAPGGQLIASQGSTQ